MAKNSIILVVNVLFFISIFGSCGKKSGKGDFVGNNTIKPYVSPTVEDKDFVVSYEDESYVYFTGQKLLSVEKKLKDKAFWMVTTGGGPFVYYMPLKESSDSSVAIDSSGKKRWTYDPNITTDKVGGGGSRTYVTEAGLVFAKTGPSLFFVSPATPETEVIKYSWYYSDNFESQTRGCVVSYKRNGERFVGMGWTDIKNSRRMFVEFPMLNEPPFTIAFDKPHITTLGTVQIYDPNWYGGGIGGWGYSCFIDQKRLLYFAACHNDPSVIDLNDPENIKEVDIKTAANNANFSSTTLAPVSDPNDALFLNNLYNKPGVQTWPSPDKWDTIKTQGGNTMGLTSYVMAGDDRGNILTGPSVYAYAFDPVTVSVWGIKGGKLMVFPRECFDATPECKNYTLDAIPEGIGVGPLSGLKDGSIIGLTRTNPSHAYLLKLKDPSDPSKGAQKIWLTENAPVDGDPYMYTDFSGATLYAMPTELTIDYTADGNFSKIRKVSQEPRFVWTPVSEAFTTWPSNSLTVEFRCYVKGESPMPEYSKLSDIKPTGEETPMSMASCQRDYFEAVDIKITPIRDTDEAVIDKIDTARVILVQKK